MAGVGSGTNLGADVINMGEFTITRVEVRFTPDGQDLISHGHIERLNEHDSGPYGGLYASFSRSGYEGVLTRGTGMRFWSEPLEQSSLAGPYPVVRWHDRWSQRWEHRKGKVTRVGESERWKP